MERELAIINSNNLGKFFKMAKKKFNPTSGIGPLRLPDGSLTIDDQVKADSLNEYFSSVFTSDNNLLPTFETKVPVSDGINNIVFDPKCVLKALNKLKEGSAGGPDGLKPFFFKDYRES